MPSCDACSSDCSIFERIKSGFDLEEIRKLIQDLEKIVPELELEEKRKHEKEEEEKKREKIKKEKEEKKLFEKLKKKYEVK
jgi:hypothetical protein